MNLNTILLEEFEDEVKTTRRFLESLSEDLFEFTPHEKSKTFGQLVNHMLPIYSWIAAIVQNPELDWSQVTPPALLNTKVAMIEQFDNSVTIGRSALESSTNDVLNQSWTMRNGDTIMFSGTKRTAIRRYVFNHTVHHRAQLGVYLRLNNMKVPASYVSSADEKLF